MCPGNLRVYRNEKVPPDLMARIPPTHSPIPLVILKPQVILAFKQEDIPTAFILPGPGVFSELGKYRNVEVSTNARTEVGLCDILIPLYNRS